MAGLPGIPPVPFGAGTINFGDMKEKRLATFVIVDFPSLDPNGQFDKDSIVRRIGELELLAHTSSVNTATALEATFQAKMNILPHMPE